MRATIKFWAWRALALPCLLLAALLVPARALATPPAPWPAASFSYLANNDTLSHALDEFGRTFGLRVVATRGVADHPLRLNGNVTTSTPDEFLNRLGNSHGMQWFQYGGTLYASLASEALTRALAATGVAGIRPALTSLGVVDPRFGWADLPERSTVIVSGPPAYVDLVARTVASLPPAPVDQEVRVFRLRHASVDDRVISYRDKEITTSGVATLMRSLMANGAARTGTVTSVVDSTTTGLHPAEPAASLAGSADSPPAPKADAKSASTAPPLEGARPTGAQPDARQLGTIQADSRLNALIVRDRPERMPLYEQLIATLDVPSYLIEIEAMIVDVNTTQATQLGVQWQANHPIAGRPVAASFGTPDQAPDVTTGLLSLGNPVGNFLMARIDALASSGEAKIVSRPSVVTIDNLGALIDLSETVYLSAVGERVANIVPVSVGVTLKVTPHVIEHNGQRSVQLIVDIEDGAIEDVATRTQPTVRKSTVGTQAVMAQDESLLIGGFRTEQDMRQHDRVPILGDIPIVGALFGRKTTDNEHRERMFVLTPKIIEPAVMQSPTRRTP